MRRERLSRVYAALLIFACFAPNGALGAGSPDSGSEVLVERNGVVISVADVARYGTSLLGTERLSSGLNRPNAVLQLIENLYVIRRAAQLAEAEGFVLQSDIAWVAAYTADRSSYNKWRSHQAEESLADVNYDELARELYTAEAESFREPDQISVDHILIKTEGKSWQETVARVDKVIAKIGAGEDFNELALEYSEDVSAKTNRGQLGFFSRGKMAPGFEAMAFAMTEPGEVSDPVVSRFGIHIIRFNEARAGTRRSFEQMSRILDKRVREEALKAAQVSATLPLKAELQDLWDDIDQEDLIAKVKSNL